jgi:hypothetical protein
MRDYQPFYLYYETQQGQHTLMLEAVTIPRVGDHVSVSGEGLEHRKVTKVVHVFDSHRSGVMIRVWLE